METGYPVRCIEIGAESAHELFDRKVSEQGAAFFELRDGAHREFKLRKVTSLNKGAPTPTPSEVWSGLITCMGHFAYVSIWAAGSCEAYHISRNAEVKKHPL